MFEGTNIFGLRIQKLSVPSYIKRPDALFNFYKPGSCAFLTLSEA